MSLSLLKLSFSMIAGVGIGSWEKEFNTYTISHGNRSVLVQFKLQFGLWQPKFGVWGEGLVVWETK